MCKTIFTAAALALLSTAAWADTAKPDSETSFNAAVTSDYRYRGITQSRFRPALQGGVDYVHNPSGLYAGAWGSTIHWTRDAGGKGSVELDLYAGKRGQIGADATYDVGVLTYVFPSNDLGRVAGFANANTTEVYGQVGIGAGYLKYSHSVTNVFGFVDSKGSGYLDLGVNVDLGGATLNLHAGRQRIRHTGAASYNDYKIGLTRDLGDFTGAVAIVGTDARKSAYVAPGGRFSGRTSLVLTASRTF